ncbi:hypothetical protein [Lacinutrix salivirga]
MEFWKTIEECLWDEGFDVMNENGSISWESEKGNHTIKSKDVAIAGNKLAWYQDEEYGRCWVRIKKSNGIVINWKPISNHSDFGFRLSYIKWFVDKLIIIYCDKHSTYVVKIENLTITVLYIGNINKIQIKENEIYIQDSQNTEFIQRIKLYSESTTINCVPIANLKNLTINVEWDSFDYYFMKLNEDYNKN